jgi:ABC-type nitrate/sulfonate/bicarbonate transport system permease component
MLILGVLALIAEWVITAVENRLFRWRPPSTGHVDAGV